MLIDEAFCSFVLNEIKQGEIYSLTWALALAEAGGNEHQAQALYVKLRVDEYRRKWQSTPLCKVPEGLAFGQAAVFHDGRLIPYTDIISVTLYSNFTHWQTGYRSRDSVTTSRSFLFRLATDYHIIEFSKVCLFGLKAEDYETLFRTFSRVADEKIIPRLAQQYIYRLTQLRETVTIGGVQVNALDGIRSTALGFRTHLPRERFYCCARSYYCDTVYIQKAKLNVWKNVSCKEANAVVLPPVLTAIFGSPQ